MNHAYEFWFFGVKRQLIHPDAMLCTAPPPEEALLAFFRYGFSARRIAMMLNNRYKSGFLERKQEKQRAKTRKEVP